MQPETMDVDDARRYLTEHFGRPIDDVDTAELEQLYSEAMREAKESAYTGIQEELLRALNLVMMSRQKE